MLERLKRQGCGAMLGTALLLVAAPSAAGQSPELEQVPDAQASAALATAQAALAPGPADEPGRGDATVALGVLAEALPALEGSQRRQARALLARPTDGRNDRFGDGYPPGAPVASAESEHFCVFWVDSPNFSDAPDLTDTSPANGIPDYVDALLGIAEASYSVEVAPGALGWQPPIPDKQGCGADPSARADIYLKEIGTLGLFGYQSADPGQGPVRSKYGYMVLDNDYSVEEYGYPDPLDPARVTVAHEFNHLLQGGYDSRQDAWMFEATATWAEDKVFPEVNDYVFYVEAFARHPGAPITAFRAAQGLKVYGTAVWNHWLDAGARGFGVDLIRGAWELSPATDPRDFAIAAYDDAIRASGGSGFSRQFATFTAASAEWRTGAFGFPDAELYPDVRRSGVLRRSRQPERFLLDHTGYRLLAVKAGGPRVRLRVRAQRGVRTGIALVARRGRPEGGRVVVERRYLAGGGRGSVVLRRPGTYTRVTAVIANADGRISGRSKRDWNYLKDDRPFKARLSR